ncbi:MAG: reverse transcriptase domain-containing protein, partial [Gloeomargaritales cyanobacterium]
VYSSEDVVPPNWEDLIMFHRENVLPPGISGPPLANDWLSPQELGEHHAPREIGRDDQNRNYVRELRHPPENEGPMEVPIEIDDEVMAPTASPDRTVQNFPLRISPGTRVYGIPEGVTVQNQSPTPRDLDEEFKFERVEQQPVQEDPGPYRTRSGRESRPAARLSPDASKKTYDANFSPSASMAKAFQEIEDLLSDPESDLIDGVHPAAYASQTSSEDNPRYHEAMCGPHKEEFLQAMQNEIDELVTRGTWKLVERPPSETQVLPGTWTYKIKRFPDGRIRKYKARFCVRGDRQHDCVDPFDTYAPVVSWTTLRLMLTMSIVLNLKTKQVDYANAFAQAKLKKPVYVELPKGFRATEEGDYVLYMTSSLYGLRQAAERWFDRLSKGLISRGLIQSTMDPCLFFHKEKNIICLIYIDDCLFFARTDAAIDEMIQDLKQEFELVVEQDVNAYLGIELKRSGNKIELTQPFLIQRILEATGMQDSNAKATPATLNPLHKDENGQDRVDNWHYASIIGMLMFLQANTRPDISYAVNQCARFSHFAKGSHEEGVKRICRYLKGTADKGIILEPSGDFRLDCYVDADFAGLWGQEDKRHPISVRSRTGYVFIFGGCPILWVS